FYPPLAHTYLHSFPTRRSSDLIVLNELCALAWTSRRIVMTSDGSPWRPVVHVEDICEAIYRSLVAPEDAVRGKIFNVGQTSENRSEEHTSELQSLRHLVCRLLL